MVVQDSLRTDLVSSPLKNDKKHRLKQRFDVQRKLGQGTYGKVQLAINRETGQEVAVKTIKKNKIENEQDLIRIRREIQIMSSIQHPHITHIYEVFENKDKIVLVMQFASGGELYDYLSEKKVLSDLEARRIFRQIAAAVYYCHKNKICHRDLKLENILLDEKGNAKIADFGLSNVFDEKHLLNTYCGSPLYASPEIVKGVPYYGPEVDCWSMGVLLYTLVYGAMPFDGSNFKKLVTQISEGDYFEPKNKSNASDLIRKLLTVNPSKRATIVDICVDYWVNLGYEHSLLQVAEDMANLTPVRLDLLLALAPDSTIPQEEGEDQHMKDADVTVTNKMLDKDIPDEEEEEEEEEDYNPDTAANSFAFMKGSRASQLSISSPNLQEAVEEYEDDSENEFLPADIAALQAEYGFSIEDSLPHISSLARMNKKCKSISGVNKSVEKDKASENVNENLKSQEKTDKLKSEKTEKVIIPKSNSTENENLKVIENKKAAQSSTNVSIQDADNSKQNSISENQKTVIRKDSLSASKSGESGFITQRKESLTNPDEKIESKKFVRPPGKIVIPKTFESPQTSPSPKAATPKKLVKSESKSDPEDNQQKETTAIPAEDSQKKEKHGEKPATEDINKNVIEPDSKIENKAPEITEEKKNIAKGILKKGIAKAKLAERKMSKQGSLDSEVSSSCSTPVSASGTPEPMPSFYKAPKPYTKEEEQSVMSKAEIKLSSTQSSNSTLKNEVVSNAKAPLWDAGRLEDRQLADKNCNWSTISSTIDSEMSSWREQMEESLRRLSPDDERSSNQSYTISKVEDDKPLVPIARSYKKFTFTKDGACITETKKIYTTPGADGSWTKVEKKTKITTRPGNAEEFEKFRDLHLRTDSPSVVRSDSQSSSGSNEVYDDIFDSWTGDTMMCNMRKMNSMFQKFSRDPFMRRERRRNPFRFFRRTESERNDRDKRKYELRSGRSNERESSENDEDYDVHFDDNSAVVYGSQGLWQLLRTANRGFPGSRVTIQQEPIAYGRSVSQDRSESKCDNYWKRCGSRASSGYNTGTRSQSRDRTESPREKMLRFVFESPRESFSRDSSVLAASPTKHEKWTIKRNLSRHNPRRDSGVGSDGYESEYSIRQSPSDEMSRTGRVSSMSSICSDKQGVIRNFMRSWSKTLMSPPLSPTSMGSAKEQLESLPESRKHRVEQWLDMNAEDVPFSMGGEHPKISSRKSVASHGSSSPSYATMRPREYLHYNRSSSDKLADCADFFPSFDDNPRRRSQSLHKENSHGEMNKMRFRSMAYSPVSEESMKDSHAYHSDSSHSGSSVHRINFTFSDGRMSSSHGVPSTTTRYVRQFSTSKDGSITVESSSPTGVRVEQVSGRTPSQPVVQMRVSINRGNRENPIVSSPPQTSKGLWEQQDTSRTLRQDIKVDRSPSPVPGIRQFSTEVQHCVGGNNETPQMSVQCEVTNSDKQASLNPPTGKSSPYKIHLPAESSIWDMACPPPCMDSSSELTNINKHDHSELRGERYSLVYTDLNHRPKNLPPFQSEYEPGQASTNSQSLSLSSNGANTPDSLEDLTVDQPSVPDSALKIINGESDPVSGLRVEVKPLGVLWGSCNSQVESKSHVTFVQNPPPAPSSVHSDDDKQRKCLEKTSSEIGSIWNQKNACHTFDLLKNLLSDDGLESFSSSKCVLSSSHSKSNRNNCSDLTTNNENTLGQNPVVIDKRIAVIDNIELEYGDKFHKMPSLMDDLQSPKEVLRQAMKICESFKQCN
ncbi:NUAK family SNF1-like kinase 1 [Nephila pilipes]|uniref:NUAK family SNF1-like kinase 1 n=1 Tax=Nephila pilipes TaxID=299642 RepID=A0A8X6MJZ0_NEPPI|nr:NUAK family SNF1-like kinase 1 [Nephila pilipes]